MVVILNQNLAITMVGTGMRSGVNSKIIRRILFNSGSTKSGIDFIDQMDSN
jgi:hypothetical protein